MKGRDYFVDDEETFPLKHTKVLGKGHRAVVDKVVHTTTKAVFARKMIKFSRGRLGQVAEYRYNYKVAIVRNLHTHRHIIQLFNTYKTAYSGALILQPAADEEDLTGCLDNYANAMEQTQNTARRILDMETVIKQAFGSLASRLAYVHTKGIRHKDIKLRNILVYQGLITYTDFGASKDTLRDGRCSTEGQPESLTRRYSALDIFEYENRRFAAYIHPLYCVFIGTVHRLRRLVDPQGLGGSHLLTHQKRKPPQTPDAPEPHTHISVSQPNSHWGCAK